MKILTLESLRLHCAADSDHDVILSQCGAAAEVYAERFLGRRIFADRQALEDAGDLAGEAPLVADALVKAGLLSMAAYLFRNREQSEHGIPVGITQVLWPYRKGIGV